MAACKLEGRKEERGIWRFLEGGKEKFKEIYILEVKSTWKRS
tara:strand:+ start:164 stop:289 length:126 start_codon:yes stop_codon:yes gene_type:complete